jgi:hypothetical protein
MLDMKYAIVYEVSTTEIFSWRDIMMPIIYFKDSTPQINK